MPSENYFHTANLRTMKIDSQLCKKALQTAIRTSLIRALYCKICNIISIYDRDIIL